MILDVFGDGVVLKQMIISFLFGVFVQDVVYYFVFVDFLKLGIGCQSFVSYCLEKSVQFFGLCFMLEEGDDFLLFLRWNVLVVKCKYQFGWLFLLEYFYFVFFFDGVIQKGCSFYCWEFFLVLFVWILFKVFNFIFVINLQGVFIFWVLKWIVFFILFVG